MNRQSKDTLDMAPRAPYDAVYITIVSFEGIFKGKTQMLTQLAVTSPAWVFIFFSLWVGILVIGWVLFRVEYPTNQMLDRKEASIAAENARATSTIPAAPAGRHRHFTMRERRAAGREVYARSWEAMEAAARREVAEMTYAERTATQRKLSLDGVFLPFGLWCVVVIVTLPFVGSVFHFVGSVFHWLAEQFAQALH